MVKRKRSFFLELLSGDCLTNGNLRHSTVVLIGSFFMYYVQQNSGNGMDEGGYSTSREPDSNTGDTNDDTMDSVSSAIHEQEQQESHSEATTTGSSDSEKE